MNIEKMISELRTEREHVDQVIMVLERMAAGKAADVEDHRGVRTKRRPNI